MKIYSMNVSGIDPADKKWYKYLSSKRIEKVEKLKQEKHKAQSVGAELLLRHALMEITGNSGIVEWDTDENGKLYLKNYKGIYVNLSHSGDYAVCAVHSAPVGIDIELCRECDIKIAKRFFSPEEVQFIENSSDRNNAFFDIWTKKESFAKATGRGIAMHMNTFSVLDNEITHDGKRYIFKSCSSQPEGYKMSVCYLL